MDLTSALTGGIAGIMLLAIVSTALLSIVLLSRYRAATQAGMKSSAGDDEEPADINLKAGSPPEAQLLLEAVSAVPDPPAQLHAPARQAARSYAVAGLLYALIMALPWLFATGFNAGRFLWLVACYAWPIALLVDWVGSLDRTHKRRTYGSYVAATVLIWAFIELRNPTWQLLELSYFWVFANAPATLLTLAFNRRSIRAVGPLVLAGVTCGVVGGWGAVAIAAASDTTLRWLVDFTQDLGIEPRRLTVLLPLVGLMAGVIIGWRLLGRLGRAYRAKRFSSQYLTLTSTMLFFAIAQSITFAFQHPAWILTGPVAFFAFSLSLRWSLARIPKVSHPLRLLLLRVFALGRRSERLFHRLSKLWCFGGPIHLISGPDLATATVEPHEFLDFLGGKLSRQFVSDTQDLDRRVAELDSVADPDRRFRVNEFFCRANNWKRAMKRLTEESDVVLMDLRGFSTGSKGCLYEIEQLVQEVEFGRILLLIDPSTDRDFLERELQAIWVRLNERSPNRTLAEPRLRFFAADNVEASVTPLLAILAQTAQQTTDRRCVSPWRTAKERGTSQTTPVSIRA